MNYLSPIKFGMRMRLFTSRGYCLTKCRNFANSRWWTDTILKSFLGYIPAAYCQIGAKFGSEMKNHITRDIGHVTKTAIFDNSHGGIRYVESSFLAFRHTHHSCNELKLSNVFQ